MNNTENKKATTPLKPEWIRPAQATQVSGLGRTKLYELMGRGKIKSASIKSRGCTRGSRLISYDSLMEYIENHVETTNQEGGE